MKDFYSRVLVPVTLVLTGAMVQGQAVGAPADPTSDDGGAMAAAYAAALATETASGYSASFAGAAEVTDEALYLEGVNVSGSKRMTAAEFKRLSALRDPGAAGNATEVIIGVDRRERVYTTYFPSRARVLITFTGGRCSGNLIGSNTVVTAGHCVHTGGSSGAWRPRTSFKVYAGANGSSTPYGYCTAKSLHSVVGWTSSRNEEYDYGAIKLNCTVGNTVGFYGYTTDYPSGFPAVVGGYPGDKPLDQWVHGDKVRAFTTNQIFYSNDTTPGSSGSGVWWDKAGAILIGVHAYGTHGSGSHALYNHGIRITSSVASNFNTWKSLP